MVEEGGECWGATVVLMERRAVVKEESTLRRVSKEMTFYVGGADSGAGGCKGKGESS